jgi:hypothetical protein
LVVVRRAMVSSKSEPSRDLVYYNKLERFVRYLRPTPLHHHYNGLNHDYNNSSLLSSYHHNPMSPTHRRHHRSSPQPSCTWDQTYFMVDLFLLVFLFVFTNSLDTSLSQWLFGHGKYFRCGIYALI